MYEYKYVNVVGEGVAVTKFQEHRELIDRYAKEGWRFVTCVPTHITHGEIVQLDLVFERAL